MTDYFIVKRNPELIERAVLDKIRAEQKALITTNSTSDYSNGVMNCLDVIDKYTAEGSNKA